MLSLRTAPCARPAARASSRARCVVVRAQQPAVDLTKKVEEAIKGADEACAKGTSQVGLGGSRSLVLATLRTPPGPALRVVAAFGPHRPECRQFRRLFRAPGLAAAPVATKTTCDRNVSEEWALPVSWQRRVSRFAGGGVCSCQLHSARCCLHRLSFQRLLGFPLFQPGGRRAVGPVWGPDCVVVCVCLPACRQRLHVLLWASG